MDECTKIFYQRVNKLNGHLGTSIYEVGKVFGFYDPLVTVTNQLILFLSSAFWGHPSPHPLRKSYMEAPLLRESVWPMGKIPVKSHQLFGECIQFTTTTFGGNSQQNANIED